MKPRIPGFVIECILALAAASICVLVAAVTLGYATVPVGIPSAYSGDGLSAGMLFKGILENGWYLENPDVGAPFGLSWGPYPMVEGTHFVLIRIFGFFTANYGSALTLFYLFSYASAALTGYIAMRMLGVGRILACTGAILFSLQTYHFLRGAHIFLASYFSVPVFVVFAIGMFHIAEYSVWIRRPLAIVGSIAVLFLAASSGVYYAFFGFVLIGFSALAAAISERAWRPALVGLVVLTLISMSVLVNLAPHLKYERQHALSTTAIRNPSDAEVLGLKFTQMAFPAYGHRQDRLRSWTRNYSSASPLVNENMTASLGFVGLAGFLFSIFSFFLLRGCRKLNEVTRLGSLNMVAFLYATVGGFGAAFAWLVTAQIRGLNRISIFIAFISLVALFLGLQQLAQRVHSRNIRRIVIGGAGILVAALGCWDQVPYWKPGIAEANEISFRADEKVGTEIMLHVAQGARIYQLPYVAFPEANPLATEGQYGLARRYLHTHGIGWSYGAMKGTPSDQWIQNIELQPLPERLVRLAASGFAAVLVERRAYVDNGRQIEAQISALLGPPTLTCPDQSCALFHLESGNDSSVSPLLLAVGGNGFHDWKLGLDGAQSRLAGDSSSRVFLLNPTIKKVKARFRFNVISDRTSSFVVTDGTLDLMNDRLNSQQIHQFDQTITLDPGITAIMMSTTVDETGRSTKHEGEFLLSGLRIDAIDTPEQLKAAQNPRRDTLRCSDTIEFSAVGVFERSSDGFFAAEPTGRWSEGDKATLICDRADKQVTVAKFNTSSLVTASHSQRMIISVNGGKPQTFDYTLKSPARTIVISLPDDGSTQLKFEFSFPDAASPQELGVNPDPRKLAVFIDKLWFE